MSANVIEIIFIVECPVRDRTGPQPQHSSEQASNEAPKKQAKQTLRKRGRSLRSPRTIVVPEKINRTRIRGDLQSVHTPHSLYSTELNITTAPPPAQISPDPMATGTVWEGNTLWKYLLSLHLSINSQCGANCSIALVVAIKVGRSRFAHVQCTTKTAKTLLQKRA